MINTCVVCPKKKMSQEGVPRERREDEGEGRKKDILVSKTIENITKEKKKKAHH